MAKKDVLNFIDSIPDAKLTGLPKGSSNNPLHSDGSFRLDMQGMTRDGKHNLQIQVNSKPKIASLSAFAPNTIAGPVLAPADKDEWTADDIKELFKKAIVTKESKKVVKPCTPTKEKQKGGRNQRK